MIILQVCLYCLLFTAMVRFSVKGGAINGLYFYPKAVQERAFEIGLTDRETVKLKYRDILETFFEVSKDEYITKLEEEEHQRQEELSKEKKKLKR